MLGSPQTPRIGLEGMRRGPRFVALLVLGTALLVGLTASLTLHLTQETVKERLGEQVAQSARVLSAPGFPLSDPALEQVAGLLGAALVVSDDQGQVLASSLTPGQRASFTEAYARGGLPASGPEVFVGEGRLVGETGVTVGVAALRGLPDPRPQAAASRPKALYVLFPEDLVASQTRKVAGPAVGVAAVALLLAALLGIVCERLVQRGRTEALLRLLVSVAHEVRNPLGAIRSLAASLSRRSADPASTESLDLIASEAERLSLLVDGLRAVGLPVRTLRRETPADEAVTAVQRLLEPQLAHRRVRLEAKLRAPGASVLADPAQLRQVVLNLVLNAADAQPEGGVVRLTSWAEPRQAPGGAAWQLAVEDEGPGVPEELRSRLFEPFFTTKESGLGVGLTLSRRLVEAHEGQLSLDPGCTAGARFLLRWPAFDPEPGPDPARESAQPSEAELRADELRDDKLREDEVERG